MTRRVRLLAVATLIVAAVGWLTVVGMLQGQRPAPTNVPGPADDALSRLIACAHVDEYPAPGAARQETPVRPFPREPPVAAGQLLQAGQEVLVADVQGGGMSVRVSDIRFCERYPTVRPDVFAAYVVAHWEIRVLRDGFLPHYLVPGEPSVTPGQGEVGLAAAADAHPFGVPGHTPRSQVRPEGGFEHATDLVWEVVLPREDTLRIDLRLRPDPQEPPVASWAGPVAGPTDEGWSMDELLVVPPGPAASGTVALDEVHRVELDGVFGVRAGDVDVVPRYPGRRPTRVGDVFIEVRIDYGVAEGGVDLPGRGSGEWTARDANGVVLPLITDENDGEDGNQAPRILRGLMGAEGGGPWLIIEAPRTGEVRLEYRRHGQDPKLFDVIVREG